MVYTREVNTELKEKVADWVNVMSVVMEMKPEDFVAWCLYNYMKREKALDDIYSRIESVRADLDEVGEKE